MIKITLDHRSADRYNRFNLQQHRPRAEIFNFQRALYSGKEEMKYEELERQRLKEREKRDREKDGGRNRDSGRDRDHLPFKRRREDRDMDGRDQMPDGRSNEGRQRVSCVIYI